MTQISKNPFVLIDGSFYLYRAYHAFPSLKNSKNQATGAIYGTLKMLRNLIMQYEPTHVAIVFDAKGKTFRDELFEYYKSNRPKIPDDLSAQIEPLYAIIKAMGLPLIVISGVEADDVIGTLAHRAEIIGHSVLISTGDKDMAQLVTSKITLINAITKTILGPEEIATKYGVPPKLIIDFLALIGDASDNIPGVPGIGKKTAQALLQGLGGLDLLYKQIDKIATLKLRGAKTIAMNLVKNKEMAYLSYQLATIKTDLKLDLTYEQFLVQKPTIDELIDLFKKYEFQRWITEVETGEWLKTREKHTTEKKNKMLVFCTNKDKNEEEKPIAFSLKRHEILLEESQLLMWIEKLKKAGIFAFIIKTNSTDATISSSLVGLSFSTEPGIAAYLPIAYKDQNTTKQISCKRALELLKPILEADDLLKIGENLKFDRNILQNYGIELRGIAFDTMLESYSLERIPKHYGIDSLSVHWLKHKTITFEEIAGKGKNQLSFDEIPIEKTGRYAAEAACIILQLHLKMWSKLKRCKGPLNIFKHIEMPLVPVLSRIECNGVKIDSTVLYKHSKEITLRLEELKKKAYEIAGEPFNLSSTKEIQTMLFKKQGIKPFQKTPGGAFSTSEKVLKKLVLDYPLTKIILEYRRLAKLKSNYIDKLPLMINPKTGRVHTSYQQAVTSTGRLSSTNPNLQNIPIRNEEGQRIRRAFISPKDYMIVSADYSQIELRIMAHLSGDKTLLTAFAKGLDIHRATAAELFDLPLDNVSNEQRRSAKIINFGLIYGMSAFGLSHQLNIPQKESKKYINFYFERYPGVREYMERTRVQARKKGYVETLDGRRLYLANIKSNNIKQRTAAERAAINAPMQGTAADIIKNAMIAIDTWLEKEKPRVRMIMQVHDELVFEVHKDDLKSALQIINELMENRIILDIPLLVEIGSGENWDEAAKRSVITPIL